MTYACAIHSLFQALILISLLLELAFLPCMFLLLALPRQVVILFSTLHQWDEQVSTVVSQVQGYLGLRHLLSTNLHL